MQKSLLTRADVMVMITNGAHTVVSKSMARNRRAETAATMIISIQAGMEVVVAVVARSIRHNPLATVAPKATAAAVAARSMKRNPLAMAEPPTMADKITSRMVVAAKRMCPDPEAATVNVNKKLVMADSKNPVMVNSKNPIMVDNKSRAMDLVDMEHRNKEATDQEATVVGRLATVAKEIILRILGASPKTTLTTRRSTRNMARRMTMMTMTSATSNITKRRAILRTVMMTEKRNTDIAVAAEVMARALAGIMVAVKAMVVARAMAAVTTTSAETSTHDTEHRLTNS